ncbi:MAG: thioredoxin domain-containing protein [Methylophilaceae bacterium]
MSNRLAGETSPYLLQHADNPVDWYPWGEEALTLAREQNKPILLSIGYSACHWCHVMAHESFEDTATAAVMNELFVNIKVDREERPDLDQIYQSAHSILSRAGGGWPLTMFLSPDQVPFFGGTYFPPTPRYNLPGFADLLKHIASTWHERRGEIESQNESVLAVLEKTMRQDTPAELDGAAVTAAAAHLAEMFDKVNGGFGGAPKFPNPADLALLLQQAGHGDENARHMLALTLTRMAEGGIYDHVGGGFSRYSVDDHWEIPHFEKMLYDNGQLLCLYSDGWRMTKDAHYLEVIKRTVDWAMREMRSPQGAFYSSLDADSEGVEGKFYVWQKEELRQLLNEQEEQFLEQRFRLGSTPNFEHAWHLHATRSFAEAAKALGLATENAISVWKSARGKLYDYRAQRIPPGRDDKILASWNALMIQGLARAARVCGRMEWAAAAHEAVDFIRSHLWREGKLLATSKDGKAHLNAYLDDHAFLLAALLDLLQADFRKTDLDFAIDLAEALLARFEDQETGGFFFTSHDHEPLIQRPKSAFDNAMPSGNGIAALSLQRLGHLTGEVRYLQAAEKTLRAFATIMGRNPAACPSMVMALDEYLVPPTLVILRGPQADVQSWKERLDKSWLPSALVMALPEAIRDLPAILERPMQNNVNAWVCRGVECLPAIADWEALLETLRPLGNKGETRL